MPLSTSFCAALARLGALATLVFLLGTVGARAQTPPAWASVQRSVSSGPSVNGANPSSYGYRLAVAADGSQYVCGLFVGSLTLGATTLTAGPGLGHLFLAKYSAAGPVLWARQVESEQFLSGRLAVDATGNAYLTGSFSAAVAVGGTTLTTAAPSDFDTYLVKYDPQGAPQWVRQGGAAGTGTEAIATDAGGNVYLAGRFDSSVDFGGAPLRGRGAFYCKLSPTGTVLQTVPCGTMCYPHALALDAAGNLYLAGEFSGMTAIGATNLTSAGRNDIFLARFDPSGTPVWARQDGGPLNDAAISLALDASGTPVVAGYYDWRAGVGSKLYLARFSAQGVPLWVRKPTGSTTDFLGAEGVAYDGRGGYVVTGGFWGSISFDPTTSLVGSTSVQLYVARYDSQGTVLWADTPAGYSQGYAVAATAAGDVYLTGVLGFDVTFGTLPVSRGTLDSFVARLSPGSILTAARPAAAAPALAVYPNPAGSTATVLIPAGGGRLALLDALGRPVYRQTLAAGATPLPLGQLPAGSYLLVLHTPTGRQVQRLVKE